MPNDYHHLLGQSDLHPNKIDPTTGTELTVPSRDMLDVRYAPNRQSNNTQSGYLSAADWISFTAKQAALGFTPANKAGDTFAGVVIVDIPSAGNTLITRVNGAQRLSLNSVGGTDSLDAGSSNFLFNGAALLLQTGTTERARISSSGFFGLNTTSPHTRMHVNGPIAVSLTTKSAAYTITANDSVILADATSAAFTITLPTAVGIAGRIYTIKKIDATSNAVTITTTSSQTIDGATTRPLSVPFDALDLISDGGNWFVI